MVTGVAAVADQILFVDFKHGRMLHYHDASDQPDRYPVVLPLSSVRQEMMLSEPVHGTVTQIDFKPTWWPTANMRSRKPSLPESIAYGQKGHPIGLYRIRIEWMNPSDAAFWQTIRIHGGAEAKDLFTEASSGCIRMLDADIDKLVKKIEELGGEVRVTFMPPHFL